MFSRNTLVLAKAISSTFKTSQRITKTTPMSAPSMFRFATLQDAKIID